MSENNKKKKRKKRTKLTFFKAFKILIILILIALIIGGGSVAGMVLSIIKDAPEIDPSKINSSLNQTSTIYDNENNLIEKVQSISGEYRTIVSLDKMPQHLLDAFISIEDERFYDHIGVDPKGIVGSAMENIKAGGIVRGASTITQQLVKNLYLSSDKQWNRKITEAYLAIQMERVLHKDQILAAYLNRIFFGQNAYGVQEAAKTYFSKDVGELTIAESALLAGVVKSHLQFQPYERIRPDQFDENKHYRVGDLDVLGERYIAVFNPRSIERQKLVLNKMLDLGKISQSEYEAALREDIKSNLKPGKLKLEGITSYFTDYVKTQVVKTLVQKLGYTEEAAEEELYTGGLKIYSTIDIDMQKQLEEVYENFTEILVGNTENIKGPILIDWKLNSAGNVLDKENKVVFYKRENLLTEDYSLILEDGTFEFVDGNLKIKNKKLKPYPKHIDVGDFYAIDEKKNLVSHTVGSIIIPEEFYSYNEEDIITIKKAYLDANKEFYKADENGRLLINEQYFYIFKEGIVQPQSATVTIDYRTGQIKAIVGGRDVEGNRILNRATASKRQPGSSIKPISVYLPALDSGYTAASPIDDIPFYNGNGELWPRNFYRSYKGMHTLRESVERSVNVNAVKTVENIGIATSMSYLEKMGIISKTHPEDDSFVTRIENKTHNDENLSALGLGGMTNGLTPLELTAAYGTIANNGVFVEPIAFTKILDKNGNLLLDNTPTETIVVSPQTAFIMKNILNTNVTNPGGLGGRAKLPDMAVAGKTGTTNNEVDIWFVGFTPYYVTGTWIGNDSPILTLSKGSTTAAQFWQYIASKIHEGLDSIPTFEQPSGIVSANICTQSGLLPSALCSHDPRGTIKSEIFVQGTVPTTTCDVHVELQIDTSNNSIANIYCPEDVVATRVFVQRTPPYNPSDNDGIVPADYSYNAPTGICTYHDESTVVVPDPLEDLLDWLNPNKDGDDSVIPLDPLDEDNSDDDDND